MAMTVTQAVAEVVSRLGGKLAWVGLSVVPDDTNADVTPAVRDALGYFETQPAGYPAVVDADLATIADGKRFIDAATLETLYRIQGAWADVDEQVDKNSQKLSQFGEALERMIADYVTRVPNPGYPRGAVGTMPSTPQLPPGYTTPLRFPYCDPFGIPDGYPYRGPY